MWHPFALKNHKLVAAAVASIVLTLVTPCSYFCDGCIGFIWGQRWRSPAPKYMAAIDFHDGQIGMFVSRCETGHFDLDPERQSAGPFVWWALPVSPSWRNVRENLWEMGAATGKPENEVGSFTDAGLFAPSWIFVVPCTIAPVLWLRRWRKHRRDFTVGHCPACGYDLRATPQGDGDLLPRCPECGANSPA
jgi:hypothetical protein